VPSDDLGSIPELEAKHHRILTEHLKITTFRALAYADRRDIHRAMRHQRPRPTLEQIAVWQDHARSRLSEGAADRSDWHPVASFAVVFAQGQTDVGWERRLEVERTEVEPEQERKIWPGWDCQEICGWMREQLGADDTAPAEAEAGRPAADAPADAPADAAAAVPAGPAEGTPLPGEPAQLQITSVAIISGATRVEGPAAEDAPGAGAADQPGPVRVEARIGGARAGQEIRAVARVLPAGERGWNAHDPVARKGAGPASFDLSRLPAGPHDIMLIAWAPDGTARPAIIRLPVLTIRPT
jgi:hypothetical protein